MKRVFLFFLLITINGFSQNPQRSSEESIKMDSLKLIKMDSLQQSLNDLEKSIDSLKSAIKEISNANEKEEVIDYSYLIACIMSLSGIIIILIKNNKANFQTKESIDKISPDMSDLKKQLENLNLSISEKPTKDDIDRLREDFKQFKEQIDERINFAIQNKIPKSAETIITKSTKHKQDDSTQNTNQIFYAKLADIENPPGFTQKNLRKIQKGEEIFILEINTTTNKGTYKINDDKSANNLVKSSGYDEYLKEACKYENNPIKNSNIEMVKSGTIEKKNDNWIIKEQVIVRFV